MNMNLDRYRVFGNPISQSKSPFIHTLFARQTNQTMQYTAHEPDLNGFVEAVTHFFAEGGKGCNVTMPFKQEAYHFADLLTERAKKAGTVNTLKKLDDGSIIGDTTDGEGLIQDLRQQGVILSGAKILLIGAGGAARGVIESLLNQLPSQLVITNRTFDKAQHLESLFQNSGAIKAHPINEVKDAYDVVINSTSTSLSKTVPAISSAIFVEHTAVYDMVYAQGQTTFNLWAKECGATHTYDGLGMLVGQAAESFMLWRGIRPSAKQVLRELRKNMEV